MTHDPLCPISNACKSPCSMGRCAECSLEKENCQCDLIAKVREATLREVMAAVLKIYDAIEALGEQQ